MSKSPPAASIQSLYKVPHTSANIFEKTCITNILLIVILPVDDLSFSIS